MEWKPVPTFDFVEASDTGLIRTLDRKVWIEQPKRKYWQNCKGKVLKPILQKSGHLNVNLPAPKDYNHYQRPYGVHRLVCLAFHGIPPEGKPFACHKDGNPSHNVPDNLYWGSPADNQRDSVDHGTKRRGESHGNTALTAEQVVEIKAIYKPRTKKFGSFALAERYGVHRTTIENIVKGRTWT